MNEKNDSQSRSSTTGEQESSEQEKTRTIRKHDPRQLREQEEIEHEMTHFPSQSWFGHCVRGQGKRDGLPQYGPGRNVPEIHVGYMFMGEEKEGSTLVLLVARERMTNAVFSTVVPRRLTGERICGKTYGVASRDQAGVRDIIVNSDNEPAVTSLVEPWSNLRAMCVRGFWLTRTVLRNLEKERWNRSSTANVVAMDEHHRENMDTWNTFQSPRERTSSARTWKEPQDKHTRRETGHSVWDGGSSR